MKVSLDIFIAVGGIKAGWEIGVHGKISG